MPFSFGRDFTYTFIPLREEIASDTFEDLASVTDAPSIYIFTDRPSRTDARAGTGAQQTVSVWLNLENGIGKKFTIAAIDDPDENGSKDKYEYYIAINFTLKDSEQVQTVIRLLPIQRIKAHASQAEPTQSDLNSIQSNLDSHFTPSEIDNSIKTAVRLVKSSLHGNGFVWSEIWNPDVLRDAISFKALELLALGEKSPGNSWDEKHLEFKNMAASLLTSVQLQIDPDGDGAPSEEIKQTTTIRLIR